MAGLVREALEFRVVTPLFLGGARPRERDDARIYVRPIVAQWRWWFRALGGGQTEFPGIPHMPAVPAG